MKTCKTCGDRFDDLDAAGECQFCERKTAFAAFARRHGLTRYPDPSGERYVYWLNGECCGKKSECIDFIDELWDALAKSKGFCGLLLDEE